MQPEQVGAPVFIYPGLSTLCNGIVATFSVRHPGRLSRLELWVRTVALRVGLYSCQYDRKRRSKCADECVLCPGIDGNGLAWDEGMNSEDSRARYQGKFNIVELQLRLRRVERVRTT